MKYRWIDEARPIDLDQDMPGWCDGYLQAKQLELIGRSRWFLLLDEIPLSAAGVSFARRIWFHFVGEDFDSKLAFPSIPTMAKRMKVAQSTARMAKAELEAFGLIQVWPRKGQSSYYTLAWPERDVVRCPPHRETVPTPPAVGGVPHRETVPTPPAVGAEYITSASTSPSIVHRQNSFLERLSIPA